MDCKRIAGRHYRAEDWKVRNRRGALCSAPFRFLSDIADAIGGSIDERGMIQIPICNIPKAIKALWMLPILLPSLAHAADHASGGQAWYQNFALYIGPIIDIGFIYFTIGACLGGFGCVAGGGGLKFGNFGIGVLFPFWKWW